jgi:hypothetical protein
MAARNTPKSPPFIPHKAPEIAALRPQQRRVAGRNCNFWAKNASNFAEDSKMPRQTALFLALATLSASAAVSLAQNAYPAGPGNTPDNSQTMQTQPAPIERGTGNPNGDNTYTTPLTAGQVLSPGRSTANAQVAAGIFVRVGHHSSVRAVSVNPENTELSVEKGVANISLRNPVNHAQILVNLPDGQVSLIKDGFYTFNANTNTVRVMKGEAYVYPTKDAKPIKVKEDHAVILNGSQAKAFEFDPFQARADLIPYATGPGEPGTSNVGSYGAYGFAEGGNYPYYGYPYGYYGYPYGIYPFGLGFYGGGFYGGGFYGGGFRGGCFHGGGRR